MFPYYRDAAKCYVYLADVSHPCTFRPSNRDACTCSNWQAAFRQSRWFTRRWTLQELLAPASVEFYSREGICLGTKETLVQLIHEITSIPIPALRNESLLHFTVEERLSWAEARSTKRIEDKAYCLFGLFGIFLSPIYGKREHAFVRLHEEIDKRRPSTETIPEQACERLLHQAAMEGDDIQAQKLLESQAVRSIDCVDEGGLTPLARAIHHEHQSIAMLLIKYGADSSYRTKGISLFELAVQRRCSALIGQILGNVVVQGRINMLSELIHRKDVGGMTPLHRALSQDDIPTARHLAMVDVTLTIKVKHILFEAATRDDVTSFDLLVKLFDTLREPYMIDLESRTDDCHGQNALLIACEHGCTSMVKALLLRGANPLVESMQDCFNVFHWSGWRGHIGVTRALIDHITVHFGRHTLAEWLNKSASGFLNQSASLDVVYQGNLRLLEIYIDHGARINWATGDSSLIMRAAERHHWDMVRWIVKKAHSVLRPEDWRSSTGLRSVNCRNRTLLHWAAESIPDLVELLINHGYDPSITDTMDCLPIHEAAFHGHAGAVKVLCERWPASCLITGLKLPNDRYGDVKTARGWAEWQHEAGHNRQEVIDLLTSFEKEYEMSGNQ